MYLKRLELQTTDKCNYSIEVSPNNDSIFFSLDEKGYILPKNDFLSPKNQSINSLINPTSNLNLKIFTLEDTIAKAKFTYDNKNIIIGDQTKTISKFILSEKTGEQVDKNILNYKNSKTWKFEFDKLDKSTPILCTGENSIFLFDYDKNEIIKEIEQKNKFIYSYSFLPNNKLATGNSNGAIYIYDTKTGEKEKKIEEHCLLVRNLEFNKNKNILYSASDDLHINQIDMNTLKLFSPIVGHKEPISDMIYNEQKDILITSSFDGTIKIWDVKGNYNCIETLELNSKNPIWDIAVSEIGDFIAFTASDGIGAFSLSK
jgi:WD40 repeat protein